MRLALLVTCWCVGLVVEADIHEEIYYGSNASKGQFKFIANLKITNKDTVNTRYYILCGGTLISPRWIVSAAHCAVGAISTIATLGQVDRKDNSGTKSYNISGSDIHVNPNYDTKTTSNDVSLFKLPSDVPNTDTIAPIGIASNKPVSSYDGQIVQIVGWGETQSGNLPQILQWANAQVLGNSACKDKYAPKATDKTICTDNKYNGASVCHGDSGGPLIASENGQTKLVGITSVGFGNPPCSDRNGADVYTYAPSYLDWINSVMRS